MKRHRGILGLVIILLLFLSAVIMISNSYLNKINYIKIPNDNESLGIRNEGVKEDYSHKGNNPIAESKNGEANNGNNPLADMAKNDTTGNNADMEEEKKRQEAISQEYKEKILNIALLGGDRRQKNEASHSDTIIILSIDAIHKKVKLSSIMRDTYVNVHGYGRTKLCHAYAYGGPRLTIRTLNENFGLGIRNYAFIDFSGFEKLVDILDGVQVDVKRNEISEINKYIKEASCMSKKRPTLIKQAGMQTLNGQQALAYSRIRNVGNGDFTRTERQRQVLDIILKKINNKGIMEFPSIVAAVLPYIETSLPKAEIIKTGLLVMNSGIDSVEQQRFPLDGYCYGKTIDHVWYLMTNIDRTKMHMHQFIYRDIVPGRPDNF